MFVNNTKEITIVDELKIPRKIVGNFIGLMFSNELGSRQGLALEKVIKVHTFFMKYPIDIFYIDKNDQIIRIDENVKPWKVLKLCRKSDYIIETNAGVANKTNSEVNDSVAIV